MSLNIRICYRDKQLQVGKNVQFKSQYVNLANLMLTRANVKTVVYSPCSGGHVDLCQNNPSLS